MSFNPHGELVPDGGGNTIPLIRQTLTIGRRDSCDIPLRLPNVSGLHCELSYQDGYWWIKDLDSTNGIKVNGVRTPRKMLQPGDKITLAKKHWTIQYQTPSRRTADEIMEDMADEEIMNQPLLERAGLVTSGRPAENKRPMNLPPMAPKPEELPPEDLPVETPAKELRPAAALKPAAEPISERPEFQPMKFQPPKNYNPESFFLAEDEDDD